MHKLANSPFGQLNGSWCCDFRSNSNIVQILCFGLHTFHYVGTSLVEGSNVRMGWSNIHVNQSSSKSRQKIIQRLKACQEVSFVHRLIDPDLSWWFNLIWAPHQHNVHFEMVKFMSWLRSYPKLCVSKETERWPSTSFQFANKQLTCGPFPSTGY